MSSQGPGLGKATRSHVVRLPELVFAVAVLLGFSTWAVAPSDAVLPLVATALLASAAVPGLLAWRGSGDPRQVTWADVAGALVLVGAFAAMLIEPQQMLRLVGSG